MPDTYLFNVVKSTALCWIAVSCARTEQYTSSVNQILAYNFVKPPLVRTLSHTSKCPSEPEDP